MWKRIAIAGAVGAAILGTGAAALAETGSTTSSSPSAAAAAPTGTASGSASGSPSGKAAGSGARAGGLRGKLAIALSRFEHGTWVSEGPSGAVTHVAIKGTATAVSPTSIEVKASDGTTDTFVVNSSTAVRVKGSGKTAIGSVKVNDTVMVTGTQSGSTDTAVHVLDGGAK